MSVVERTESEPTALAAGFEVVVTPDKWAYLSRESEETATLASHLVVHTARLRDPRLAPSAHSPIREMA